jgi:hypothetical protein
MGRHRAHEQIGIRFQILSDTDTLTFQSEDAGDAFTREQFVAPGVQAAQYFDWRAGMARSQRPSHAIPQTGLSMSSCASLACNSSLIVPKRWLRCFGSSHRGDASRSASSRRSNELRSRMPWPMRWTGISRRTPPRSSDPNMPFRTRVCWKILFPLQGSVMSP